MSELSISILGPLKISLGGQPLNDLKSVKAQALLVYLAITRRAQSRQALAGLLWSDVGETSARGSLRTTLARLRNAVGDAVFADRQSVAVDPERSLWVDAHVFEDACRLLQSGGAKAPQGGAHPEGARQHGAVPAVSKPVRDAIHLYQDEFLADFFAPDAALFEEWLRQQRETYRRQALEAFHALAQYAMDKGQTATGIEDARRLLTLDPVREGSYRLLMKLLAQSGQIDEALRHYQACVHVLDAELGVPPAPETEALYEAIREGRLSPAPSLTPPITAAEPQVEIEPEADGADRHNLPRQMTPFVGRDRELALIHDRLADPHGRLLTIVGLGGMGKTRLAIEAAGHEMHNFGDGVCFVTLAQLSDAALLSTTIANALHLPSYGGSDPDSRLLRYLGGKELLLVLDNFEHLLDGSHLVEQILVEAPKVKVLVTSRERLRMAEEWLLPLEGLDVPESGAVPALDRKAGAQHHPTSPDAVALFVQRASRLQPEFKHDPNNVSHVTRICRLMGGIPLAIELAASWLRTIPLAEIAGEIESNLDFLTTSLHNVPAPHRSMRAVFDRSWQLLDKDVQRVMAVLSVFRGGFTRAAATQVADASLLTLSNLVDSSWLRLEPGGRYDIHELVRQYAAENLESESERAAAAGRAAHARYFGLFAEAQSVHMDTEQQKRAMDMLLADVDNMRAGWRWAVDALDIELIDKYVECLKWMADTNVLYLEVIAEFDRVIRQLRTLSNGDVEFPQHQVDSLLARLLAYQSFMAARAISLKLALPLASESLAIYRSISAASPAHIQLEQHIDALAYIPFVSCMGCEFAQAEARCQELIRLAAGRPEYGGYHGMALLCLGYVAHYQGRFEEARRLYSASMNVPGGEESTILAYNPPNRLAKLSIDTGDFAQASHMISMGAKSMAETGFWSAQKDILYVQALIAMHNGELSQAKQLLGQVRLIAEDTGMVHAQIIQLLGRARWARLSGQPREAQRLYKETVNLTEPIGRIQEWNKALVGLGWANLDLGLLDEAKMILVDALRLGQKYGMAPFVLGALAGLGAVTYQTGNRQQALEWCSIATSHPSCFQAKKDDVSKMLSEKNVGGVPEILSRSSHPRPQSALDQVVDEILQQEAAMR